MCRPAHKDVSRTDHQHRLRHQDRSPRRILSLRTTDLNSPLAPGNLFQYIDHPGHNHRVCSRVYSYPSDTRSRHCTVLTQAAGMPPQSRSPDGQSRFVAHPVAVFILSIAHLSNNISTPATRILKPSSIRPSQSLSSPLHCPHQSIDCATKRPSEQLRTPFWQTPGNSVWHTEPFSGKSHQLGHRSHYQLHRRSRHCGVPPLHRLPGHVYRPGRFRCLARLILLKETLIHASIAIIVDSVTGLTGCRYVR